MLLPHKHSVHIQNYFFTLQKTSTLALQAHLAPEAPKETKVRTVLGSAGDCTCPAYPTGRWESLDELGHFFILLPYPFRAQHPGAGGGGRHDGQKLQRIPTSALAWGKERHKGPPATSVPALEPHLLPMGPLKSYYLIHTSHNSLPPFLRPPRYSRAGIKQNLGWG